MTTPNVPEIINKSFDAISNIISSLDPNGPIKINEFDKLEMYGFYKVATVGKNNKPTPSYIFNFQERLKWNNWKNKEKMDPLEAKKQYCDKFSNIILELYEMSSPEDFIKEGMGAPKIFIKDVNKNDIFYLIDIYESTDKVPIATKEGLMNVFKKYILPSIQQ